MDNLLIISNLFIIINFLILTAILWIRKDNSLSNILLGIYILLHVFVLSFNLLVYHDYLDLYYYFLVSIPACLIGPLAYLYCRVLLEGKNEPLRLTFYHFIPAFAVPVLLFFLKTSYLPENSFSSYILKGSGEFPDLMKFFISCHIAGYYFYTWYFVKRRDSDKTKVFSNYEILKINWAKNFIYSNVVLISAFFLLHLVSFFYMKTLQPGSSIVSPLICLFLYFFILRKAIAHSPVFTETKENKPIYPVASEETLDALEISLKNILKNEKPYLDKELTLKKLSLFINASPKHLSQLLNNRYQKNFNDFINSYRIEESKKMLQDPDMNNLKLEAIAEAAGFNSRASFFSIFKKFTGHTPASYRKEHCLVVE